MDNDFIKKLDDMKVYTDKDLDVMYNQWLETKLDLPQEFILYIFNKRYK